jgi:ZIP family zinc transporter
MKQYYIIGRSFHVRFIDHKLDGRVMYRYRCDLAIYKKKMEQSEPGSFSGTCLRVMIAVVLFDMLPSAFLFYKWSKGLTGILSGVALLFLVDKVLLDQASGYSKSLIGLGYLIMLGIALHDLPEGIAIAMGSELKDRTGAVIALGIAIHNIPEGMAIAAPLIMGGMKRRSILLKTCLIALVTPAGTLLGQLTVNNVPQTMPFLLGFASGIMLYLVLFQLWPQAGKKGPKRDG